MRKARIRIVRPDLLAFITTTSRFRRSFSWRSSENVIHQIDRRIPVEAIRSLLELPASSPNKPRYQQHRRKPFRNPSHPLRAANEWSYFECPHPNPRAEMLNRPQMDPWLQHSSRKSSKPKSEDAFRMRVAWHPLLQRQDAEKARLIKYPHNLFQTQRRSTLLPTTMAPVGGSWKIIFLLEGPPVRCRVFVGRMPSSQKGHRMYQRLWVRLYLGFRGNQNKAHPFWCPKRWEKKKSARTQFQKRPRFFQFVWVCPPNFKTKSLISASLFHSQKPPASSASCCFCSTGVVF